jgi:hypothetical protein
MDEEDLNLVAEEELNDGYIDEGDAEPENIIALEEEEEPLILGQNEDSYENEVNIDSDQDEVAVPDFIPTADTIIDDEAVAATQVKVKRPSSAWMIYMNQNRDRIRQEHPAMTIGEVAKTLSAEYKSLTQDLLDVYLELARKDKERYVLEMSQNPKSSGNNADSKVSDAIGVGEIVLPLVN